MLTSNKRISNKEFIVAADKPMKDHVTSLHLMTDVFKISFNNASALVSPTKERFEDEQDWGP